MGLQTHWHGFAALPADGRRGGTRCGGATATASSRDEEVAGPAEPVSRRRIRALRDDYGAADLAVGRLLALGSNERSRTVWSAGFEVSPAHAIPLRAAPDSVAIGDDATRARWHHARISHTDIYK